MQRFSMTYLNATIALCKNVIALERGPHDETYPRQG
jgi:hypothetical protein